MSLNARQQLFVQEYLVDLNATQAAIRAGYSARTAEQQGPRLLQQPTIKAAVEEAMAARVERIQVTADSVIEELAKIGFSDIRRMFSAAGSLRRIEDLDDNAAAALSSVEVVTRKVPGGEDAEVEHVAKIKLWDKRQALVDLGKHLGLFKEQIEHSGGITVEIVRLGGDE
jgi:phage terminase small subunit